MSVRMDSLKNSWKENKENGTRREKRKHGARKEVPTKFSISLYTHTAINYVK